MNSLQIAEQITDPMVDRLIELVTAAILDQHLHKCFACGVTEYRCSCEHPGEPMICPACDGEVF